MRGEERGLLFKHTEREGEKYVRKCWKPNFEKLTKEAVTMLQENQPIFIKKIFHYYAFVITLRVVL